MCLVPFVLALLTAYEYVLIWKCVFALLFVVLCRMIRDMAYNSPFKYIDWESFFNIEKKKRKTMCAFVFSQLEMQIHQVHDSPVFNKWLMNKINRSVVDSEHSLWFDQSDPNNICNIDISSNWISHKLRSVHRIVELWIWLLRRWHDFYQS